MTRKAIHHIDGDPYNNHPANLLVVDVVDHAPVPTGADLLRVIGPALFGDVWLGDLADALGVAVRTVERWASGKMPVPDGVWRDLATECQHRGESLKNLAESLRKL